MPKINEEEYKILKGLDDKWKWIARDEHSASVEIFQAKPYKVGTVWMWEGYTYIDDIGGTKLFQFIQWEDEKPYNIQELIEEYEYSTVKKDLKEAILGIEVTQFDGQKTDLEELVNPKQLEKIISDWMPEVLTQEWIDENITQDDIKGNGYVAADALYGLLVPKQEEVDQAYKDGYEKGKEHAVEKYRTPKPVIPQFVADWFEEYKEDEIIIAAGPLIGNRRFPKDIKVARWLNEDYVRNSEVFAQAWLAYPNIEVEEEQKYRVEDSHGRTILGKMTYSHKGKTYEKVEPYNDLIVGYKKELTQQQIKDYDPRYWAFRRPVEELEE